MSDLYKKLTAPFGKEAMSTDSSRGFNLTSVKAQYVVERLNEVFGPLAWSMPGEYTRMESGVLFIGNLTVHHGEDHHTVHAMAGYGKVKKDNWGDAYKSAKTDALGKACSMLGIANEVFKGNVDPITREWKSDFPNAGKISSQKAGKQRAASLEELEHVILDMKETVFKKYGVDSWENLPKNVADDMIEHYTERADGS